jgi:hypothetical protein
MKCRWNQTMLNLCNIVVAILKLEKNNKNKYVGRLWCPELIPDIEKFLPITIFKMATTIPQKFNIIRYHQNLICGWKWRPVEIFQCRESMRDIIIYPHIKFWWYRTMLNFCVIVAAQHCSISTSWIDSRHRKISTGLHFQNGHHNTAKIQHCSISKVAFN